MIIDNRGPRGKLKSRENLIIKDQDKLISEVKPRDINLVKLSIKDNFWGVCKLPEISISLSQEIGNSYFLEVSSSVATCDSHQGPPLPYFSGYIPKANWTKS